MNFANVKSIVIPDGNVDSISIGSVEVWSKGTDKLLTLTDFQNGTFGGLDGYNSHTLLSNQQDGSDGFTVTGMALTWSGDAYTMANTMPHWICNEDLTPYSKVSFYAKKTVNYGMMRVHIFNGSTFKQTIAYATYSGLSTDYTKYEANISCEAGDKLWFVGGYHDSSGGVQSETSYCNIILHK